MIIITKHDITDEELQAHLQKKEQSRGDSQEQIDRGVDADRCVSFE